MKQKQEWKRDSHLQDEVASQLSYYQEIPVWVKNLPEVRKPANFELFFGEVPLTWHSGPIPFEKYKNGRLCRFFSIAEAIRACHNYVGHGMPLAWHSYPGLDMVYTLPGGAGSKRIINGKNRLFPTCVMPLGYIKDYLNIVEESSYICSPCD